MTRDIVPRRRGKRSVRYARTMRGDDGYREGFVTGCLVALLAVVAVSAAVAFLGPLAFDLGWFA